ncbi:MAG: redox-regulated ATPase YchF [Deltaproteobacteria bacterium]|nr:redox-regulated ATPase YchF [Deltaproteobacteria bacterium]NIS77612.1 redox-regulated ATPase YchF [Deltaproteobacteria bacterium]
MKIGIFGGPLSGKSTLLGALVAGFGYEMDDTRARKSPFVVSVPDERVDYLEKICKPKKKVYQTVTLLEIQPGSESLIDGQNVSSLRGCDVLLLLIPLFLSKTPDELSPSEGVLESCREIETDLCLADYLVIQKRLERLLKEGKKSRERELMQDLAANLESGRPVRDMELREDEKKMVSGFSLLSEIPIIAVVNAGEDDLENESLKREVEKIERRGVDAVLVCAKLEEEIMCLDPDDREMFMREVGIEGVMGHGIVKSAYRLLNLITFLTVNPNEVRSWSIVRGASAREAAGRIHSDMERGFIRAEVIPFKEFVQFNDMARAKAAGRVRVEGKDYIVEDGDIVTVRFNV